MIVAVFKCSWSTFLSFVVNCEDAWLKVSYNVTHRKVFVVVVKQ